MVNANDDEMRWKTFGEARMFYQIFYRTQRKKYMVNGLL